MNKQVSYFPVISLKQMALRRVAVILVNNSDSLVTIQKVSVTDLRNYSQDLWIKTLSSTTEDTFSKLSLPREITSEMIPILKAVYSEVQTWRKFHESYVNNLLGVVSAHLAKKICWTTSGTVDYRKTSETLIHSSDLNRLQRFEFACLNCLEDYIPVLWKKLSEEDKKTFYNKEEALEADAPNLELLLPFILKRPSSFLNVSLAEVRREPLKYAAFCGNKSATEYCFRKYREENRESFDLYGVLSWCLKLALYTPGENLSNVFCYLLSLMTPERQLQLFQKFPSLVLARFFSWSCQDLLLDMADVIWPLISEDEYEIALFMWEFYLGNTGYYFPNIVQEFFLRIPRNARKVFSHREHLHNMLLTLFFHAEDSQTIEAVFRSLDAADRMRLVFYDGNLNLFDAFLLKDSWHMVEVCIREASLSEEDRKRLRVAYVKFVTTNNRYSKLKLERFFEVLSNKDANTINKRSIEDETILRVKKVCKK